MTSIITGLDTHTPLQTGENLHTERSYSNDLNEKVVQFFFQLVRCSDHTKLEQVHRDILLSIKGDLDKYYDIVVMMYKLIGQTRDIINGKGEQKLAFMQIMGFYEVGLEYLALSAIRHFVHRVNDEHPFGSWKDIKYFCQYVKDRTKNEEHPLIVNSRSILLTQLEQDWSLYQSWQKDGSTRTGEWTRAGPAGLTLAGRWCPRGKSQHKWLHNIIAKEMNPHFMATAKLPASQRRALNKCRIKLTHKITTLNKLLDTTQVKQCGSDWSKINFNNVTSATMRRQSHAFANKNKHGMERFDTIDRRGCATNLTVHMEECKKNPSTSKVHGRRLNVYELVKDAYSLESSDNTEKDRINLQWEDNKKNNMGLGSFIPCVDVSYSMHDEKMKPLFSSIGLGIRCSEMTHPAFRDRVMTFGDIPTWHNLSGCLNFTDKVDKIKNTDSGVGTNFYRALKMLLDVIIQNDIPPKDVESMVLAVFSDMQIEEAVSHCYTIRDDLNQYIVPGVTIMDTMFTVIEKMYSDAGMRSKYNTPFRVPHLLFWNLRSTTGFPVSSTTKNVSMLSGFNSTLLNAMCNKGIDALKEFTPGKMLRDILSQKRYAVMESDVREFMIEQKCKE